MNEACMKSNCGNAASKCCGSCGCVWYCSSECQKEDWKEIHKRHCVDVKKLSSTYLNEIDYRKALERMEGIGECLKSVNRKGNSDDGKVLNLGSISVW